MVVNEHTIITMDLLFVETRPRQNWGKKKIYEIPHHSGLLHQSDISIKTLDLST